MIPGGRIVRIVSAIVPADRREEWRAEWESELANHWMDAHADHGVPAPSRWSLAARALGSIPDALWMRRRHGGSRMLRQDLRVALRMYARKPGFAAVVALTLALGIGATTAIFSVVHGVLLRPLPYPDADRIVVVWETDRNSGTEREGASIPDYFDFRERSRTLAPLGAFREVAMNLTDGREATRVAAAAVTASFFDVVKVSAMMGRTFDATEDSPGGPAVAVVSEGFWRTQLAADPGAVGRTLRLDDSTFTVVGVLPDSVALPSREVRVWVPLRLTPTSGPRSNHSITVVARLAAGATLDAAQREMTAVAAQLEELYPRDNSARGVNLEPLPDVLLGAARAPLAFLLWSVALLLIIACANVANLLLARMASRRREVAVRRALGANAGALVGQFVAESLVLAALACGIGILLAKAGVGALLAVAPDSLPRIGEVSLSAPALAVAAGLSALVAFVFGVLPSVAARRVPLGDSLVAGDSRTGTSSRQHRRARGALVVAEVALSLVLVVSAGLLVRSFLRLSSVDPGFAAQNVVRVRYQLSPARYPQDFSQFPAGWSKVYGFHRDLVERVRTLPGVSGAAVATNDPLVAGFTNSFVIEGREEEFRQGQAELATRPAGVGYFETLRIPLVAGRTFTDADRADGEPVVVINEAAARRYFPNETAVGRRLRFWGAARTIVGVVGNERFGGLSADAPPAMYPPLAQAPLAGASLLVRVDGDADAALARIREAMRELDPSVAPYDAGTMQEAIFESLAQQRFAMMLLATFAGVALVLALVGIYGVISYTVAQRTRELGIRVALGASRTAVVRQVLTQGAALAGAGIVLGIGGALAARKLVASQLYGISPSDPGTIAGAAAATMAVALLACWLPARRAASVSPLEALRSD